MTKQTIYFLLATAFACTFISCGGRKTAEKTNVSAVSASASAPVVTDTAYIEKTKKVLLAKDNEFSDYSVKNGTPAAFINYIADDGVMLRPNHKPIVGKDSVTSILNKRKAKNVTMKWTPLFAEVANSCDLGYTYGTYEISGKDTKGNTVTSNGTYVSIWKKDKSGNWKLALDSGNEGLNQKNKPKQKATKHQLNKPQ